MFPLFGQKRSFIHAYPIPTHALLIEPFAGSCSYALEHWDRSVWINERDRRIYAIWRWLKEASALEILSLPIPKQGDDLRTYRYLSQEERDFLYLVCSGGDCRPRNIVTCIEWLGPARINGRLKYTAERLHRIRHWRITNLNYQDLPRPEGTWFIDAPYQELKPTYRHNSIDYPALLRWCQSLPGEVIVCEGSKATWLEGLRPLVPQPHTHSTFVRRIRTPLIECMWTKGF
jgi:hypothetical protein